MATLSGSRTRRLLAEARPWFRALAEAVEACIGVKAIEDLRAGMATLRQAIETEID